jgi:hypothetical protein
MNTTKLAETCAKNLIEQGWVGGGGTYDIGVYHGDHEALADELGRKPTQLEVNDFEREIKRCLDVAA